jgi:flagellar motility protein MotE (MotC chaperone)
MGNLGLTFKLGRRAKNVKSAAAIDQPDSDVQGLVEQLQTENQHQQSENQKQQAEIKKLQELYAKLQQQIKAKDNQ